MKKLCVVSPAYYTDSSKYEMLTESCKYFKLDLHLYGMGEEWPWYYNAKVIQLAREIDKIDAEYILVCDADDAFFMAGENEILHTYRKITDKILVAADRVGEGDELYPQSIFRDLYPPSATPWRYCNSGGYIGKKQAILHLLNEMAKTEEAEFIPVWRSKDWSNDQFRMSVCYLNGYDLKIDTGCKVFQTMGSIEPLEYKWGPPFGVRTSTNFFFNKATHSFPCVIHFNGNAPGIKEAYNRCFELETTR